MKHEFWHERWKNKEIGFHRSDVHPFLERFAPQAFAPKSTVLVPLCGKSLDLIHLAKLGHTVIGVELSPLAVEQFFQEQHLTPAPGPVEGALTARELPITLWCGDFFAIPPELTKSVDAVYDRAALIALPADMRARYAAVINQLKKTQRDLRYLLISIDYGTRQQAQEWGPPFGVSHEEIASLYSSSFKSLLLHTECEPCQNPRLSAQGITQIHEFAYLLS